MNPYIVLLLTVLAQCPSQAHDILDAEKHSNSDQTNLIKELEMDIQELKEENEILKDNVATYGEDLDNCFKSYKELMDDHRKLNDVYDDQASRIKDLHRDFVK